MTKTKKRKVKARGGATAVAPRTITPGDQPRHGKPAGVLLRLPRSLHVKLKEQASDEGVSMAQHILRCLAETSKAVELGVKLKTGHVDNDTSPVAALDAPLPTKCAECGLGRGVEAGIFLHSEGCSKGKMPYTTPQAPPPPVPATALHTTPAPVEDPAVEF